MILNKTDIDQLLEDTVDLKEDIDQLIITKYEIDVLLEKTQDW